MFLPAKEAATGTRRGGVSRKMRPILQACNKVGLEWRARLSEHLGYYTVEPAELNAAEIMDDRLSLAGLNAAVAVAREALPEREPHPRLFDAFEILVTNFLIQKSGRRLYVKWEAGLLRAMGMVWICPAALRQVRNLT